MTSIRKVTIENFQSHEHSELEFTDGLNVIIGPSDQGKSAVIRAIKWVFYNEPRGIEYIRQGASAAKVCIELSNGNTIIRERSKSRNRYIIKYHDERSITLEGFGNEVPEEVINAHGIPRVVIDTDNSSALNIGDQLEGPFLLSENGSTRAKAIGRLTGMHITDAAIRSCLADLKRENQTSDRTGRELKEIDEKLIKFADLEKLKTSINDAESLIKELEGLEAKIKIVEVLKIKLASISEGIEDMERIIARTERVKDAEIMLKQLELQIIRLKTVSRLKENRQKWIKEYEETENTMSKYAKIIKCEENLINIENKRQRLSVILSLYDNYTKINAGIKEGSRYLQNLELEMNKLSGEYLELLKRMGKCPFCNSIIDESKINDIIKHFGEGH
ncbi:MAG: AAA family ATPase [Clostridia bacterium]|nr:AAA family ATPase [Clostridia bacterium]